MAMRGADDPARSVSAGPGQEPTHALEASFPP